MSRHCRTPQPLALTFRRSTTFSLVLISLFTSACGWQLRGAQLEHVQVSGPSPLSVTHFRDQTFLRQLTETLERSGFQLSSTALPHLEIEDLVLDKRVLTVNLLGQVTRYHLSGRLSAYLKHPEQPDRFLEVQAVRDYNHDVDRLIASNLEAEQQEQTLRNELIRRLIQKLKRFSEPQDTQ